MKSFATKQYKQFNKSRQPHRKILVKFLRVFLSLLLFVFGALRIVVQAFGLIDIVLLPIVLLVNLIISTLVLKPKYEKYSPVYLAMILQIFISSAFELAILDSADPLKSYFGLQVGQLFTLVIVSKLPCTLLLCSTLTLLSHVTLRLLISYRPVPILTPIIFLILNIILNFIYLKQELIEFDLWKSLQCSKEQLINFQQAIQGFPSKILVFGPKGNLLYQNEEVMNFIVRSIGSSSIDELLDCFSIDSEGEKKLVLKDIITQNTESMNPNFSAYFANFTNPNNIRSSLLKTQTKEEERIKTIRFEIKIGKVKWGEENHAKIIILNDISKSESIRELKILHENKDRMLATVSHELRTPLNGMIGMLDIIESSLDVSKEALKYIKIAKHSAKALLLMINDILDVAQIEKGTLRLNIEQVEVNSLINQVLPLIKVQAKKKGIKLIYENDFRANLEIMADPMRFQQIMLNLLSNACKFCKEGFIKIRVEEARNNESSKAVISMDESDDVLTIPFERCEEQELENEKWVKISVEDTGVGIQEEDIPRLFQLFGKFQHKGNATGVGLGLAISQKLATQMGFEPISVRSIPSKGSTFSFMAKCLNNCSDFRKRTMFIEGTELPNSQRANTTQSPQQSNESLRILVVDDDQINHIVMQQYIKTYPNFQLERVYNGKEAVEMVLNSAKNGKFFDLIFMDCNMPIMDGFEASRVIKASVQSQGIPLVRIIALTANISKMCKEECLQAGMDEVWIKPLEKKDFVCRISSFLICEKKV